MKSKLISIDIINLHHTEVAQFINRYFEDLAKSNLNISEDSELIELNNKIDNQRPLYNQALDQIRVQEETQQIALLDQYRDDDVVAFRFGLKAYRKNRDEIKLQAYNSLAVIVKQFDGVENDNYEQETIRVFNMTNQLMDDKHKPLVEILKMENFVEDLIKSNTAFNELFANRSYEKSIKVVLDTKALRKQLTEDYKQLAKYVETMADLKKNTDFYKNLLAIINNGRQYYANIIAKRKGKNKDI